MNIQKLPSGLTVFWIALCTPVFRWFRLLWKIVLFFWLLQFVGLIVYVYRCIRLLLYTYCQEYSCFFCYCEETKDMSIALLVFEAIVVACICSSNNFNIINLLWLIIVQSGSFLVLVIFWNFQIELLTVALFW